MNQTHIHLLITHLPIFGSILGGFVLIHGIWRKSNTALIAAYHVLIISAIGAAIAYATGEGAEETVEHIQGISKNIIEEHAESALTSLIGLIVVGVISMVALFVTWKNNSLVRPFALVALIASLTGFGLVAKDRLPRRTDRAYRDQNQRSVTGEYREWQRQRLSAYNYKRGLHHEYRN